MPLPPNRVDYLPLVDRPRITWPNGARLAFWVSPNVEHYEYTPVVDSPRNPWPRTPFPDVQSYALRDYGNRVGFWRMVEVLDKHGLTATVSLNLAVLEHYPEIAKAMVDRDYDFMYHGIYNTRYLLSQTEAEEREFYRDGIDTLKRLTGKTMKGMLGPAVTNTPNTPDLMAEAGLIYHTDWFHDDQPVPIKVKQGKLVSVPYSLLLNDAPLARSPWEADTFADMCKRQFDVLFREGEQSGRVMCIALHPFVMGAPHRIRQLDEILGYIKGHPDVWFTTADQIAEYYIANHYEDAVVHAQKLAESSAR